MADQCPQCFNLDVWVAMEADELQITPMRFCPRCKYIWFVNAEGERVLGGPPDFVVNKTGRKWRSLRLLGQ